MAKQTFKVAGITAHGEHSAKVRFTDDLIRRIKQFTKGGATRIELIELPKEMNKIEALEFLLTHPTFQSDSDQATIKYSLEDKMKEAGRGTAKVRVAKAEKPSIEAIKARAKKNVTAEDVLAVVSN